MECADKVDRPGALGIDRRFYTAADRLQNHDEIDQAISAWTKQYSSKEVEDRLRAVGISADRVRRINEVIDSADSGTAFSRMAERRLSRPHTPADSGRLGAV